MLLPPPLFASPGWSDAVIVLFTVVPFWLTVLILSGASICFYHRRKSRQCELGAEMIRDMLGRKMSADEIERVLTAWGGHSHHLKKLAQERARANATIPAKPAHAVI